MIQCYYDKLNFYSAMETLDTYYKFAIWDAPSFEEAYLLAVDTEILTDGDGEQNTTEYCEAYSFSNGILKKIGENDLYVSMNPVKLGENGELLSVDDENIVKYKVDSSSGMLEVETWYKCEYDSNTKSDIYSKTTGVETVVISEEEYIREMNIYSLSDTLIFRSVEEMREFIY